jgi:GNAT superfamily N-acetyltransferase
MKFEHCYLGNDDVDRYYCKLFDETEEIVGWCKYYTPTTDCDDVCIEYIYIENEHRRKGYATLIVKELIKKYGQLTWDYRFTSTGRHWYESLIKKGVVSI